MFFSSGLILWMSLTFFFHLHIVMSSQAPTLLGIMTYPFFYLKLSFFTFLPFFSQITALLIFCLPITLLLVNSLIWSLMIAQQHSIKWGKWEDCTLLLLCLDSRSSRAPFAVALKKKKKGQWSRLHFLCLFSKTNSSAWKFICVLTEYLVCKTFF